MSGTIFDKRQLDLFADPDREDELIVFYRRLREVDCSLHYDRAAKRLVVWSRDFVPKWAVLGSRRLRARIIVDLLRLQYGVTPAVESEALDGGATLHRLPTAARPELDPPVRYSLTGRQRQLSAG
jgi:hypothetical protein